jgi:hypothetical protein
MSEKNARGKAAKPRKGGEASVLGNLPSTRPTRMGRQREGAAATAEPATAKPRVVEAKPRPTAAKPRATSAKPRAVRSGSPSLERPAPARAPRRQPPPGPPKGTELVTTAVQAAGELAQIGVSLGGRMVKRAVGRLPKP